MNPPNVDAIKIDNLPIMRDERGALTVAEFNRFVPFTVARLFYVRDVPAGSIRGQHAHYQCSQYMICQSGRLRISMTDGIRERVVELASGQAILVEPGIFATETYLDADSAMLFLCDRPYERDDYIHTMEEFLDYHTGKQ
jgi:UDP-2-acetamido-3-amino-2,3-dideoxy-glucuronate N-acetyltransferase